MSGVLLRRNFNYHLLHPSDLGSNIKLKNFRKILAYTELSISCLSQKESVYYDGPFNLLLHNLGQLSSEITIEKPSELNDSKENENKTPSHILKMFKVFIF